MVDQKTEIDSLVGLIGLWVIIMYKTIYIYDLQCKNTRRQNEAVYKAQISDQEVSGSNPRLDR